MRFFERKRPNEPIPQQHVVGFDPACPGSDKSVLFYPKQDDEWATMLVKEKEVSYQTTETECEIVINGKRYKLIPIN